MSKSGTIQLRTAIRSDAAFLYRLRNEPSARSMFGESDAVDFARHYQWLIRSMRSKSVSLYLILLDESPVGTIRLDQKAGSIEVSITVRKETRSRGVCFRALRIVQVELQGRSENVWATIKKRNLASLNCFSRSGFRLRGIGKENLYMSLQPTRSGRAINVEKALHLGVSEPAGRSRIRH